MTTQDFITALLDSDAFTAALRASRPAPAPAPAPVDAAPARVCEKDPTTMFDGGKYHRKWCKAHTQAAPKSAPTQEQDDAKSLVAELTLALMSEHGIGWVKANIRARKLVA